MSNLSKGKYALFISDRSGLAFPYREMVREWNGARVHTSEFEPKQPQLEPKPYTADPQGLPHPRPARVEPPTVDFLNDNPFTTIGSSTLVTVAQTNSTMLTDDAVRFQAVKSPVGGVTTNTLQLGTTLNGDVTTTANTIVLNDTSIFPTSGFVVIEKVHAQDGTIDAGRIEDETVQYTGVSGSSLTGCIRGTAAPFRGKNPPNTIARTHSSGAKVFGSYKITMIESSIPYTGQPSTLPRTNSFTFNLKSNATSTETGGGLEVLVGPVNVRA